LSTLAHSVHALGLSLLKALEIMDLAQLASRRITIDHECLRFFEKKVQTVLNDLRTALGFENIDIQQNNHYP